MLDTSIPLNARPPEIASPTQQLGQAMQLRDLMDQKRVRQQQITENDLKLADMKLQQEKARQIQSIMAKIGQPKGGMAQPAQPAPAPMPNTLAGLNGQAPRNIDPGFYRDVPGVNDPGFERTGPAINDPGFARDLPGVPGARPPQGMQQSPSPAPGSADVYTVEDLLPELMAVDPAYAEQVMGKWADHQKKIVDTAKAQADVIKANLEIARAYLGMAKDEASYQAVRPEITKRIGAQLAGSLPGNYDPQRIAELQQFAFTVDEYLKGQRQALEVIGLKEKNTETLMAGAGKWLSTAKKPEEYAYIMRALKGFGYPTDVLSRFPQQFDQNTPRIAADLAMTVVERERAAVDRTQAQTAAVQAQTSAAREARMGREASTAANPGDDPAALPPDPTSQNILSQTGLSINAFRLLTGQSSQLARDKVTRERAAREAETWARARNVDISTLASQYKTYNDVLSANIARLNNTKIMEGELDGTIDNLKAVAKDADLKKLRIANVFKIWAGQEVNDPLAQQYALHLGQLRNELSAYYAATQGRTGNNITLGDQRDAELVIRNGVAKGSLDGLKSAVKNSTDKMDTVMRGSVDRSRQAVWGLFGVGQNYQGQTPSPGGTPPPFQPAPSAPTSAADPLGLFAKPSQPAPAPQAPAPAPQPAPQAAPSVPKGAPGIGQTVTYNGKTYRIKGYNGANAILEEIK